jgi:hypothetical protein
MSNPSNNQSLWRQLVAEYRQACWLRREGREAEANQIVNEKLPVCIANWSNQDGRTAVEKKAALETMFSAEQSNVDSWLFAHQMLAGKLSSSLLPAIRQQVGEEVREMLSTQSHPRTPAKQSRWGEGRTGGSQRVRFDDIPAVIDSLLSEQAADYGARCTPIFA